MPIQQKTATDNSIFPSPIETIINEIKSSTIGDLKKMAAAKKKQYKKKEVKAKKKAKKK